MLTAYQIAVIGDYRSENKTHRATNQSLHHAAQALGRKVEIAWLPTMLLEGADLEAALTGYDGYWVAPGSPYASMEGALRAIRWARERGKPFIGT
jgi:CTP synthase (UTP-ammonia lyase)